MKLFKQFPLAIGMALATALIAGCASSNEGKFFSDGADENNSSSTTTTASMSARISTNEAREVAKFHVGDTVTVTFSGLPPGDALLTQPHIEPIKEDGTIELPEIGKVQAAGKTAGQLQNDIHDLYVPSLYRHLTVTVNSGDRVYFVSGEVHQPGRLVYTSDMTVTKAIGSAGDFTDFANHGNVLLIRRNGKQMEVNCDRILAGKDPDPPVYPGDQIIVRRRFF